MASLEGTNTGGTTAEVCLFMASLEGTVEEMCVQVKVKEDEMDLEGGRIRFVVRTRPDWSSPVEQTVGRREDPRDGTM
jgi:hypothetical protein